MIQTYQVFERRIFVSVGSVDTNLKPAAEDFAALASEQSGVALVIVLRDGLSNQYRDRLLESGIESHGGSQYVIDMEGWPTGLGFGDWVEQWADRWSVIVDD